MLECRCFQGCPDGKSNSTCLAEGKCYKHFVTISRSEHELRMGCLPAHTGEEGKINQCHTLVDQDAIEHDQPVAMDCCDPTIDGTLCNDRLNITPPEWKPYQTSPEIPMAIVIGVSVTITFIFFVIGGCIYRCIDRKKKGLF